MILSQVDKKEQKTAENKRKRRSTIDDEELDEESMDWWSKYFVSMDTLISVSICNCLSSNEKILKLGSCKVCFSHIKTGSRFSYRII